MSETKILNSKEAEQFLLSVTEEIGENKKLRTPSHVVDAGREEQIEEMMDKTLNYFLRKNFQILQSVNDGTRTVESFMEYVNAYIEQHYAPKDYDEDKQAEFDGLKAECMERIDKFLWKHGVITELLDDPDISDVRCIGPSLIRYKKFGKRYTADVHFRNKDQYEQFVRQIGTRNQVSITDQNAIQSFTDIKSHPDFILRYTVSTKYVNTDGFDIVHIRKIPKNKKDIFTLIEEGLVTKEQAAFLINVVRNKGSILFCGRGGSGKTTLMNCLIDYVNANCSIECIQENEELFTHTHPEMVCQHVVANKGEGKFRYELKDLARYSLVSDIDMFIIGEIKGEEARYILTATNTGAFYMASIHSSRASEALVRLADYIKYASDYSMDEILKMMATNTDVVLFLEDYRLKEVLKVLDYDKESGEIKYEEVCKRTDLEDRRRS